MIGFCSIFQDEIMINIIGSVSLMNSYWNCSWLHCLDDLPSCLESTWMCCLFCLMLQGGSTDANSSLRVPQWLQLWLRCRAPENSRGIVWPFQCKGKTTMGAVIGRLCMAFFLCKVFNFVIWMYLHCGVLLGVEFACLELWLGKRRMKCSSWVVMSWLGK